ncbi:MAG: VWA domain-containing protein, partial [Verrucomicrobiota bacterium]|nr:VWA domain-containing protein [Verrucomicrobiota bacterium]
VSPRLLPQLGAMVNRFRRNLRFALLVAGLGLALVALAQPRWGYTYEEVKRKGLDLIIAVDTSRSMLANDVPPNRLQRVKLAGQDLINELRGDRVGLIAFAGRAFLQAPLTIDYDAATEALTDLDTNVIPEGGTNISEAITLAVKTYGKSAVGNRALIIFTDGEDLAGESVAVAKTAADAGVRIFTVGVGTPEGSLIPLGAQSGGTAFVKDPNGQVVKSKLDEGKLREIAQVTGGMFFPLTNGPETMRQLYAEGLSKMQAAEIDARMSQQPIERYQWPLGAALLALAASMLISERTRHRRSSVKNGGHRPPLQGSTASAVLILLLAGSLRANAASPGLDAYRAERFPEAYAQLQQTLEAHPDSRATDKIQFDAGAAAYKMKEYAKASQSFSQALLSPDVQLQERSHYNLGNTLYQRGETQKSNETKLTDWTNALQHYDEALKIDPKDKQAKENSEFVKKKIEELKKQQEQKPSPTPTPSPSPSPNQKDKKDQKDQKQDDKDKKKQDQQSKPDDQQKDQQQKDSNEKGDGKKDESKPGESPSPSPGEKQGESPTPSPSPSAGKDGQPSPSSGDKSGQPSPSPSAGEGSPSPSPGEGEQGQSPTPSPADNKGEGSEGNGASPTPAPPSTPAKKPSGDVKGAPQDQPEQKADGQLAETEQTEDGQMSEQQAERLLRSMKDEEQRVQLDERKRVRRVYKDW